DPVVTMAGAVSSDRPQDRGPIDPGTVPRYETAAWAPHAVLVDRTAVDRARRTVGEARSRWGALAVRSDPAAAQPGSGRGRFVASSARSGGRVRSIPVSRQRRFGVRAR